MPPDTPSMPSAQRVSADFIPSVLSGVDGEPPIYVNKTVAATADEALAYAANSGELYGPDPELEYEIREVLMRELDPIACRARGYEEGWWVECTPRSKKAVGFWRIDE